MDFKKTPTRTLHLAATLWMAAFGCCILGLACQEDLLLGTSQTELENDTQNEALPPPTVATAAELCGVGDAAPRPFDTNENAIFRTEDKTTFVFLDDLLTLYDIDGSSIWSIPFVVDPHTIANKLYYDQGIVFSHIEGGEIHLTRVDDDGNILWTTDLSQAVGSLLFEGASAHVLAAGGGDNIMVAFAVEDAPGDVGTVLASYSAADGTLEWSTHHSGTDIIPQALTVMDNDTIVVVGGTPNDEYDLLVFSSAGSLLQTFCVIEHDTPDAWGPPISYLRLRVSPDGGLYLVGIFSYAATLRDDVGNTTSLEAFVNGDWNGAHSASAVHFIARFDATLGLAWAVSGYSEGDSGPAMAEYFTVDDDGGMLIWGSYSGDVVLGRGQPGATILANGSHSEFRARYTADGVLDWAEVVALGYSIPSGTIYLNDDATIKDVCTEEDLTFTLEDGSVQTAEMNGQKQCVFLELCPVD